MSRSFGPIRLGLPVPAYLRAAVPHLVHWAIAIGALAVRLYLASLWFRFGATKLEHGWLTTNPVRALLTLVSSGQTPMPLPSLAVVADALLAVRADVVLSVLLPIVELALAAAFLTGAYVRVAAAGAIAVNTSLILGGLASASFDGKIIALQLLLLAAGRLAGTLGLPILPRLWRRSRRRLARPGLLVPSNPRSQLAPVRDTAHDGANTGLRPDRRSASPPSTCRFRRRRRRAVVGRSAA